MLMLPEDDTVLSWWGESSKETISAPWSVRALAVSRKLSLWLSIWAKPQEQVRGLDYSAPFWGNRVIIVIEIIFHLINMFLF